MIKNCAIAIFVKTPDLSPVKTRLAKAKGEAYARKFYELSVKATSETVSLAVTEAGKSGVVLHPYWAVAEKAALSLPQWDLFPRIWQGEGELGDRLHQVYAELKEKHDAVILIGSDSPQLASTQILNAIEHGKTSEFVFGPATDGGFFLCLGQKSLAKEIWTRVSYSAADTLGRLADQLSPLGKIAYLPVMSDVDEESDLPILLGEFAEEAKLTASQVVLRDWVKAHQLPLKSAE